MKDGPHIPALGDGEPTSPPNQDSAGKSPGYMRRLREHLDANPDLIGSMLIKGLPINYGELRDLLHEVDLLGNLAMSLNRKLVLGEARAAQADNLLDLARNVGGFDDRLLASADVNLLRATLREFRDQARRELAKTSEAAS